MQNQHDTAWLNGDDPGAARVCLEGVAESRVAIDRVIAAARNTLSVFDACLADPAWNNAERCALLKAFLLQRRGNRLRCVLHQPDYLERDAPRLVTLLRQYSSCIEIRRTLGEARCASDPLLLADDHSYWHRLHIEHPRFVLALNNPVDAVLLSRRFEEIWESSEPGWPPTTLGL